MVADFDFLEKTSDNIEFMVNNAINEKVFPGCVVLVSYFGKTVFHKGFGCFDYSDKSRKINKNTIYDLASLTKVIATVPTIMILKDKGEIDLDKKVNYYLPEFKGRHKSRVKIRNLLSHSSGLPSWKPLFETSNNKTNLLENLYKVPLEYIPETDCEYSDLGFILLGEIIERIASNPLDKFCRNHIFKPLKMRSTYFCPPKRIRINIPPTEHSPRRERIIQGEVHDENAYVMGGVSAHAGLFSNVTDIAVFCQMILNGGTYNGVSLINSDTIREFTKRVENINQCKWALGWRIFMGENDIMGSFFSERSFGHLGYTGTSIWIDPERELFTILLTNRVHPTSENKKISDFRPALHDEIMKSIRV